MRLITPLRIIVIADYSEFFDPAKLVFPSSEEEVVSVVEDAVRERKQLRVVGSGHSRNALAYSDDIIVSLEQFRGVVRLDKQAQQV